MNHFAIFAAKAGRQAPVVYSKNRSPVLAGFEPVLHLGNARRNRIHEINRFVERLEACGVSLLPNGKRNLAALIMLALLAEMARAEVDTLRERINSGLAEARRKGVTLGRPKGTTVSAAELIQKHRDVVKLLRAGHSVRHTAKISGRGASTVQRIKALMDKAA